MTADREITKVRLVAEYDGGGIDVTANLAGASISTRDEAARAVADLLRILMTENQGGPI